MSHVWTLPPLWVRRVVLAPLLVVLAFVWMPIALWLGIFAAGVVAWAFPGKLRVFRVVFMVGLYLLWDAVALVGIQDGTVPFVLATTPPQIAEERRLLYVGITRAREHLRISWSRRRSARASSRVQITVSRPTTISCTSVRVTVRPSA